MEHNWNFHNYISVPLDELGRQIVGASFFSADEIDNKQFVDAMLQVLSVLYSDEELCDFIELCQPIDRMPGREIDRETAEFVYNDFKRLLNNKKR